MSDSVMLLAMGVCLVLIFLLARQAFGLGASKDADPFSNMRSLAPLQYSDLESSNEEESYLSGGGADQLQAQITVKVSNSRMTLEKRLRFAQLSEVPSYIITISQILVSTIMFLIAQRCFYATFQAVSLITGPLLVNFLINYRIETRFKKFDRDFPQFLVSLVGMLKTGLNPVQALEAAGTELEEDSLVRHEVELLVERLRMGVSEERSVGSFAENIHHPETELFVQAFLISHRVGGNLSETLERLARQARKRQYFRGSARAAVGLQRGSMMFIVVILIGLEVFLYFMWPEPVILTWTDPEVAPHAEKAVVLIPRSH